MAQGGSPVLVKGASYGSCRCAAVLFWGVISCWCYRAAALQVMLPWPADAATFNSMIREVFSSLRVLLLLCISLYLMKYLHEITNVAGA